MGSLARAGRSRLEIIPLSLGESAVRVQYENEHALDRTSGSMGFQTEGCIADQLCLLASWSMGRLADFPPCDEEVLEKARNGNGRLL